jgi:hypothetical protein
VSNHTSRWYIHISSLPRAPVPYAAPYCAQHMGATPGAAMDVELYENRMNAAYGAPPPSSYFP